jgi:hypothetical protein
MKLLVALATCLLGIGCSSAAPPSPIASEPALAAATPRNSLGTIRTRDREMTLVATSEGVKVTVRAGSTLVANQVDVDTLRSIDPVLYDILRSGTASRPYLDATLHPSSRRDEIESTPPSFEKR